MIEVSHLSKYFGENIAVDDISFTVDRGEVLGFLGPNAAGKSTTMRMITGFLPPHIRNSHYRGERHYRGVPRSEEEDRISS